jgi:hypothetical protein
MGAPMGNRNAAGGRGGVSRGAKKYLAKTSGRTKFTKIFKKNWGKAATKWEVKKALFYYRRRVN